MARCRWFYESDKIKSLCHIVCFSFPGNVMMDLGRQSTLSQVIKRFLKIENTVGLACEVFAFSIMEKSITEELKTLGTRRTERVD
jgi:hypothetical protein